MKEFIINENEAGQRFDKYLAKLLREAPKSFFYKMMRKKNITLNGKKATGNEKLFSGDHVKLFLSDETFEKFSGNDSAPRAHYALDIIYEDENILLINKPAGMLSQPADDGTPSLVEYLTGYLLKNGSLTENDLRTFRPSVCNRLDRNTSGLIAAGKSLSGLQELSGMFKSRELHKYYLCLVEGVLKEERYIKGYLAKDKKSNKVTIYKQEKENALPVETKYYPLGTNGTRTLLKVELITGRAHQIRAHLASEGHSIVGDPKYGKADKKLKDLSGQNQYLPEGIPEITEDFSMEELEGLIFGDDGVIDNGGMLVSDDFIIPEEEFISKQNALDESPFIKIEKDPRVTKVGRVLRKYSLDELPQLVNILKGDMSVVGNRPLPLYEAERLTNDESIERFMAPAGLTGLWQVEKRGDAGKLSAKERKELDLKYGKEFSFFLDMKILFKTLTAFVQKGDV